jgi:co-chaperonin GroES (HSP10)
MNYTPNGKRLIITRKKHKTESKGGILLPETITEKKLSEGYIVRAGEGCEGTHWKEGLHVIFAQFAGQEIQFDDEVYLVMPEDDVLVYGEED